MDVASAPTPTDLPPPPGTSGPSCPSDRVLGGVAGLLAARLGLDPLWVRLGFVLLALVGGLGLVVYLGLWLTLVVGARPGRTLARYAGGAVVLIGVPLLVNAGSLELATGPFAVVALFVGLAVALWQPRAATARPAAFVPAGPATAPSPITTDPMPPRPPSILGRTTLGAAVVVAAGGALVDHVNGGRLYPEQWLGLAAGVCGLGLLVGAFRGHARWLVLPAAAFATAGVVGGVAAEVGAGWGDLAGDRWIGVHRDMFDGPQSEVLAFGTIHVDIGEAPGAQAVVGAEVGVGEVRVTTPDDVTVEIRAAVDDGDVRVNGVARRDGTIVLGPEGAPDVVVHAQVERGSIEVEQYPHRELAELDDEAIGVPTLDGTIALGQLTEIADGVTGTADGWIVLLGGEAIIDPDDRVVVGPSAHVDGAVTAISTSYGEYRLLPRSILLGPTGEVLDLRAVRQALERAGDGDGDAGTTTTDPTDTTGG